MKVIDMTTVSATDVAKKVEQLENTGHTVRFVLPDTISVDDRYAMLGQRIQPRIVTYRILYTVKDTPCTPRKSRATQARR